MATPFSARVISPEQVLFDGDAEMVAGRTLIGEIAFFAGHAPLVGALEPGPLRVLPAGGGTEESFDLTGGFVEVRDGRVTVLAAGAGSGAEGDDES